MTINIPQTRADLSQDARDTIEAQIGVVNDVARLLTEADYKAEATQDNGLYPSLGVIITDPYEPKATWDFWMNASDQNIWVHSIAAIVGDEYESVHHDTPNPRIDIETPALDVAVRIAEIISDGIPADVLATVVSTYDSMSVE